MSQRAATGGSWGVRAPLERRGYSLGRSKSKEPRAPQALPLVWAQRANFRDLWLQPVPLSSLLLTVPHIRVLFCLNLRARTLRRSRKILHPMFKNSHLAAIPLVTTNTAERLPCAGRVVTLRGPPAPPLPRPGDRLPS